MRRCAAEKIRRISPTEMQTEIKKRRKIPEVVFPKV